MADPLIILLLVASPEVGQNVTHAMSASAREALGPTVRVLVENRTELPSDEEALTLARQAHAAAVVELRWANGAGATRDWTRMQLHAHVPGQSGWIDRTLTFAQIDDPAERGRTVGLAVASMMPLEQRASPAPKEPEPAPRAEERTRRDFGSVDGMGLVAVGAEAPAWGGHGSFRIDLWRVLAVQVVGSARAGSVSDADADALTWTGGGGLVVRIVRGSRSELAISGDVLAVRQSLHRGDASASRWLLGAQLTLEGTWFFTERLGGVLAVGEEVGFGATRVFVGPDRVATIAPFHTVVRVGLRVRF